MSERSSPYIDWALLILRLSLGVAFLAHGSQKLFPIFGGPRLAGFAEGLGNMGLHPPMLWAVLSSLAEFGGGLLVLIGLLTRFGAAAIAVNMLVAVKLVHLKNGFWASDHGYEYNLALIAMSLALVLAGAGALSLDSLIALRCRREPSGGSAGSETQGQPGG